MTPGDLRILIAAGALGVAGIGGVALIGRDTPSEAATASTLSPTSVAIAPTDASVVTDPPATDVSPGLVADEAAGGDDEDGCVMTEPSVRVGSSGATVKCLQEALVAAGYLTGPVTGSFDAATERAVLALQEREGLFVDGVAGRETGIELGIWPDEESQVVRTPPPPPGAEDLMGYELSSVASAGDDAPPLPANSGSGRRLVYSRVGQRVWAVGDDGQIIRSWLVSGSKYSNEVPGTHEVYSRSEMSTAWNGKAYLPLMVRWLKTERGALGFHSIPLHVDDNSPYQTEDELGQRLSGGCQRQAPLDAKFVWAFATVGTPVVVI
ncbi:MAG: peptidoglycan-binding protein [Ilumatobacteraceae bacterium]